MIVMVGIPYPRRTHDTTARHRVGRSCVRTARSSKNPTPEVTLRSRRSRRVEAEIAQARRAAAAARAMANTAMAPTWRVRLSTGEALVPAFVGAGTTTVTVPISPAMPDDRYVATPTLRGGLTLLGGLTTGGVTAQSVDSVTVAIRASGLVALGATVTILALKQG